MQKNSTTLARLLAAALVSTAALSAHADAVGQAAPAQPAQPVATAPAESDAAIVEKVKAALKGAPGAESVAVSCKDSVVTLSGTVPAAAIDPTLKAVASVSGIKEIKNELKAG